MKKVDKIKMSGKAFEMNAEEMKTVKGGYAYCEGSLGSHSCSEGECSGVRPNGQSYIGQCGMNFTIKPGYAVCMCLG